MVNHANVRFPLGKRRFAKMREGQDEARKDQNGFEGERKAPKGVKQSPRRGEKRADDKNIVFYRPRWGCLGRAILISKNHMRTLFGACGASVVSECYKNTVFYHASG